MPTYQYACTECGHQFDQVQSFSDAALTECPACGGKLRKVFGAVGVVFKGSGFYRNDSRSADKSSASSQSSSSADSKSSSSETKPSSTESKPAASSAKDSSSSGTKPAAAAS